MRMMFKYELKKVFSKRINQIVLAAALILAVVLSVFAAKSMFFTDGSGKKYTGLLAARKLSADKNRWKGELTEEKVLEISKTEKEIRAKYPDMVPDTEYGKHIQSYDGISTFVAGVFTPDSDLEPELFCQLSEEEIGNLYGVYRENMKKMAKEYGDTPRQQEFLQEQYERVEMPLSYKAPVAWDTMTLYAETYAIILAIVVGFLAAGIFSEEFSNRAESVFFAAKYGRTGAVKNKVLVSMLMATMVYWAGMGVLSLLSFGIMGVSGFTAPYQLEQPYSIYTVTYGQLYLLILACGYVASLLGASLSMLVTAKMRSASVAVCIPFFLYCVLPFIGRALSAYTTFFKLTPNMLTIVTQCVKSPDIFQAGNVVVRQVPFVALLYFALAAVLLPLVYRAFRQYGMGRGKSEKQLRQRRKHGKVLSRKMIGR